MLLQVYNKRKYFGSSWDFFSFQNCSEEKQPVWKKLKRGYGCVVCMLLITAAGREEVSEVQDVVAWRRAVATAPLCPAAESEPQSQSWGQTSEVNPLTG